MGGADDTDGGFDVIMFDELERTCPVYREWCRQMVATEGVADAEHDDLATLVGSDDGPLRIDLVQLWFAAGSPSEWGPAYYADYFHHVWAKDAVTKDGTIMAGAFTGLHYCSILDDRVMRATVDLMVSNRKSDPIGAAIRRGDGISVALAKWDLMDGGMTEEEANDHLIGRAKEMAADLDEYRREAKVAEIQKAAHNSRRI